MKKTLIIMAAGMGSRYGGLKQLDIIGPSGETIIDYSVYDAIKTGFDKIVFIIRKDIEQEFRSKIGSHFSGRIQVEYVLQGLDKLPEGFTPPENRQKPWGTGHAMLCAAPVVDENFLIINADDFYGRDAFARAAAYLDSIPAGKMEAGLVGFYLKNTLSENGTVARGICEADASGNLSGVEETLEIERRSDGSYSCHSGRELKDSDLVSMNMWAFSPAVFEYTEDYFVEFLKERAVEEKSEFYIPLVVNTLIERENTAVKVLDTDSVWYGVTYKEDKDAVSAAVRSMVAAGAYPEKLWKGE